MPNASTDFVEKVMLLVIDKGILAIVVLVLGLIGTRFIERYKAAITTQEELVKRRIESAAAVCAKLELLRRLLYSLHKAVLRGIDWKKDSELHHTAEEHFSEELRVLCEDIQTSFGTSIQADQSNLSLFVCRQDVAVSSTLAANRYWLGSSLYRQCVRSHASMLKWYKTLLDKDQKAMEDARLVAEKNTVDLGDALSRGNIAPIVIVLLILALLIGGLSFFFYFRQK